MKPVLDRDLWAGSKEPSVEQHELASSGRDTRRDVELSGYLIRANKSIVDIKIVDLSYDGCGVRTFTPLIPGEKLKLTLLGRGSVNAVVRWYSARNAGLVFLPDPAPRPRWPRKAERVEVNTEITLRRSGRATFRVAAFDITRFGCKCEFVERPAIYERVFVKLEGLDSIQAVVCWVEGSNMGLMFKTPMHPAVFDMVLMRLPLPQEDAAAIAEDE